MESSSINMSVVDFLFLKLPIFIFSFSYCFEIILTIAIGFISIVIVFGNLLVVVSINLDPMMKKSVYQYFQSSLCFADILLGIVGAGKKTFRYSQFKKVCLHTTKLHVRRPDDSLISYLAAPPREGPIEAF